MLDKELELAFLRKSMSGSAGPCSPELLSRGHGALKAGSTDIGSAVDRTLSDYGGHGGQRQFPGQHQPGRTCSHDHHGTFGHAHFAPHFRKVLTRPAIARYDPGLAASLRVRYRLRLRGT
jgi:hypothetical protein